MLYSFGVTFNPFSVLPLTSFPGILFAGSTSCRKSIISFKIEACPSCRIVLPNENQWQYNMSRHISFMDHTAELTHPNVPSSIISDLFGFQVLFVNLICIFVFLISELFGRGGVGRLSEGIYRPWENSQRTLGACLWSKGRK